MHGRRKGGKSDEPRHRRGCSGQEPLTPCRDRHRLRVPRCADPKKRGGDIGEPEWRRTGDGGSELASCTWMDAVRRSSLHLSAGANVTVGIKSNVRRRDVRRRYQLSGSIEHSKSLPLVGRVGEALTAQGVTAHSMEGGRVVYASERREAPQAMVVRQAKAEIGPVRLEIDRRRVGPAAGYGSIGPHVGDGWRRAERGKAN